MNTYYEISQASKRNIHFDCVPFCIEKVQFKEDFAMHTHDFAQLIIVMGGSARLVVNGHREPICEGNICVIQGNSAHGFEEVRALEFVSVLYYTAELSKQLRSLASHPGFTDLFVLQPSLIKEQSLSNKLSLDYDGMRFVVGIVDTLLAELEKPLPGYETLIQSYFMILITYLSRAYVRDADPGVNHPVNLNRTVLFMEKNYRQELTVEELAAVSNMSQRQLRRLFARQFGCAPLQYLTDIRIKHACHMLRCSNLSVSQVAAQSGFSDSNYFSRKFKQYTALSPQQYRKRERKLTPGTG